MNIEILLDREGDLPAPTGVQVIESEVDFLRFVFKPQTLLIRGLKLCEWAESFYNLRGYPMRIVVSPSAALRQVFPELTTEQARELAEKIGKEILSTEELSTFLVLNACYPNDYQLWQGRPSREHAARWLLWLIENTPTEAEAVVLRKFTAQLEADDISNSILYRASTSSQAEKILMGWLGADKNGFSELGEFPLELPPKLLNQTKNEWMKRIIATKGAFFGDMIRFPLSLSLRQELARLTAEFFLEHTDLLARSDLHILDPYLDSHLLAELEQHLPPPEPSSLPEEETAVLDWFESEYLPYRRWQAQFGDATAKQKAVRHAQTFAGWLLEQYPRWLISGENLIYQKSARLPEISPDYLILCVVFDGLPAWDAETFVKVLSARTPRLVLIEERYCFTTIPTITEFAKEALLKGVPPRLAAESPTIGQILPDNRSPVNELKNARPGQIVFWRVEQPDKAYHFEQGDKRDRKVRAELDTILQAIVEVVENLPNEIPLQILIISDHGRLMNPQVPRQLPVPVGFEAHGRAAWGNNEQVFPECGYVIDEDKAWVELYGERFGLTQNLRIAWDEKSFNINGGNEPFPHGGLFPEEVLVPWFVLLRDAKPPELEIKITGEGEADMSGELVVSILNHSPLALECREVAVSHGFRQSVNWDIAPLSQSDFTITLTPWPPKSAEGKLTATLVFSQPNGVKFTCRVSAQLTINALYETPDIFKDLDK
jgi:hypothetical protein